MADTQDSVEILLKKARERRAKNAEALLLQREKTGSEKMCKFTMIITLSKI